MSRLFLFLFLCIAAFSSAVNGDAPETETNVIVSTKSNTEEAINNEETLIAEQWSAVEESLAAEESSTTEESTTAEELSTAGGWCTTEDSSNIEDFAQLININLIISTAEESDSDDDETSDTENDCIGTPIRCAINEIFVKKKPSCPPETCDSIVSKYDCSKAPPPKPGCMCKSGFKRLTAKSGCIPLCQCPQLASSPECILPPPQPDCTLPPPKCTGPNEVFTLEKSTCPGDTCRALVIKVDCSKAPPPKPGCVCKSGYFRKTETSPCIPMCKCPEMAYSAQCQPKPKCTGPNEVFTLEKSTCPGDTCRALVIKVDCSKAPPPKPGCVCKSGYFRKTETSPCIPMCKCPEMAYSAQCQPKPKCTGPNQVFTLEKSTCPGDTCRALVIKVDCSKAPPPKPGCVCKSGYFRKTETSPCIPMCKCPEMAYSAQCQPKPKCTGPNEVFTPEKSICPGDTCRALVIKVDCSKAPPPKPGCVCKFGYSRKTETSPCIPMCKCPEMAYSAQCQPKPKCTGPNEVFTLEKSTCPGDTCRALVIKVDCSKAPPPKPGCVCKSGYFRKTETSPCIPMCKCPEMAYSAQCQPKPKCTGPNEVFTLEKSTCPGDTCRALVIKVDCSKAPPPKPGCVCKSGYFRKTETSPCIPMCKCPEMAYSAQCQPKPKCTGPNEVFTLEKSTCPGDTCRALVIKVDCSKAPPPKPGCVCKSGYFRKTETSPCIPMCKCPEMAYSAQCQPKPKCTGPNQVFTLEKSTCPGDTCRALVIKVDCSKAPPPKPGCVCKSGYFRKTETSPCIPMCKCPEMAYSAQCQPKPKCTGPNEVFTPEKSICPGDTCRALVIKVDCSKAPPPKPGCVCKFGYSRKTETSPCIPMCKCPEMAYSAQCQPKPKCTGPNEVFTLEKSTCPGDTCRALVIKVDCSKAPPPKPGCVCKSGYFRKTETSPCIPMCKCPEMAYSAQCQPKPKCTGPNEVFTLEKSTCPGDTCRALVIKVDCSKAPPPKPGCVCKSGYFRKTETSPCIPMCKCPEMAYSAQCQPKPKCTGPNEVFTLEKSTCPGDTCRALFFRIDCTKAPPPQPGCVCKSGFFRKFNETSSCVPICECAGMAFSAQCLKEEPTPLNCGKFEIEQCVYRCSPERTCRNRNLRYKCMKDTQPCTRKCICKPGYFRNAIGECVTKAQCEKCSKPNEFFSCGPECDNECKTIGIQNRTNCPIINKKCNEKCYCDDGYARDAKGNCIPVDKCETPPLICKLNEEVRCVGKCPTDRTCKDPKSIILCKPENGPCQNKCVCKPGYFRNSKWLCIKASECGDELPDPKCTGQNEEVRCVQGCTSDRLCKIRPVAVFCPRVDKRPCAKKCFCKDGYFRNSKGQCVTKSQCEPTPLNCGDLEIEQCVYRCPPERTCRNRNLMYKCSKDTQPCVRKCICKPGYFRDATGKCVTKAQCDPKPNPACTGPNEEQRCITACPPQKTCKNRKIGIACPAVILPCKATCVCKSGYVRNDKGKCIKESNCPPLCKDPNEEYLLTNNCPPDLCASIVGRYNCQNAKYAYVCRCKNGYLRLKPGSPCIPINKCPQHPVCEENSDK